VEKLLKKYAPELWIRITDHLVAQTGLARVRAVDLG
jgi:hypothetical protein